MHRRFFCDSLPEPGGAVELPAAEAHHLQTVLRAHAGDVVTLLDGRGGRAKARVCPGPGRRAPGRCEVVTRECLPPPALHVTLVVAPPRGKLMSHIIRQATELGVSAIRPALCQHSESRPGAGVVSGWEMAAREACKQSGNPYCPEVAAPATLGEWLRQPVAPGYVGWVPQADAPPAAPRLAAERLSLWIGPEGGFAPEEIEALLGAGLAPLALGRWTLRVETAVVAGLAWLLGRPGA